MVPIPNSENLERKKLNLRLPKGKDGQKSQDVGENRGGVRIKEVLSIPFWKRGEGARGYIEALNIQYLYGGGGHLSYRSF